MRLLTDRELQEQTAPGTPASGQVAGPYAKPDKSVYIKDSTGAERRLDERAEMKGFVNHGATAGTARPSGYASIEWYGSVAPTNVQAGDTWIDTSS